MFTPVMTLEYLKQKELHTELSRNYWTPTEESSSCTAFNPVLGTAKQKRENKKMNSLGSIFLTRNARVSVHGIASAIAFVHLQSLESANYY